jgi:hypothetical protein
VLSGDFDEVNRRFRENGWTDGLPIVPPTRERVEAFLAQVEREPDAPIATLPLANLNATPRNVAVNAVMAGCAPEHMPVLVAAVEAIADPLYNLSQIGTTAALHPFLVVNGPLAAELGIEHGIGTISRGPNPVLGRALGLILANIAGFRAGELRMGTWGYALPFVLAEDEAALAELGWPPLHVERGHDAAVSTVTALGTFNWGWQAFPRKDDIDNILAVLAIELAAEVHAQESLGAGFGDRSMATMLITPPTAAKLARAGYSKQDVRDWLWRNSTIRLDELNRRQRLRGYPKLDIERDPVPLLPSAEQLNILVCGDATRDKAAALWVLYLKPATVVVKPKTDYIRNPPAGRPT